MPRDVDSGIRERIASGFVPAEADGAVEARVRASVDERTHAPAPARPPVAGALRWLASAAVLAVAITAGFALYGRAVDGRILSRAAAAIAEGGVLHYKLVTSDGVAEVAAEERWVDAGRELARSVSVVSSTGPDPGMTTTSVDRGSFTRSVTYRPRDRATLAYESWSKAPFRDEIAAEVAAFRRAVLAGDASVTRRETVDGVDTWRIETNVRVWWQHAPAPDEQAQRIVANISASDFAPVRIVLGADEENPIRREFAFFERLEERSVPATLFELPLPGGVPVTRQRELSADDLAGFKELPVSWLGRKWEGMPLAARFGYFENPSLARDPRDPVPAPPMGWPDPVRVLPLEYGGDGGMVSVQVMGHVDESLWWWFGKIVADQPPFKGHWVPIDAKTRGLLFEAEGFPPVLVLERDGATVVVSAGNCEDPTAMAIRAAKALRGVR